MSREKTGTGKWKYGSVSVLMLVMVLAALIALNAGVYALEKKKSWRIDLSFNGILSQSEETREVIRNIQTPVEIYALFAPDEEQRDGAAVPELIGLLDKYAAASDRITWKRVNPALNPDLLVRFTANNVSPATHNLIVSCEETGRFRVLGDSDLYTLTSDPDSYEMTYDVPVYNFEKSITAAIAYVTSRRIPQVVILQGHNEDSRDELQDYLTLMERNQFEVVFQDLKDPDYTPDPEDLLVFFSPKKDLTDPELDRMREFAARGGSFLFTCDWDDDLSGMPNYAALLRSYGFDPLEGLVLADETKKNTYYSSINTLIPEMCSTDLTLEMMVTGHDYIIMPGTRAFAEPEETDRNLSVEILLRSGETSCRMAADGSKAYEFGSFPLALETRRVTTEGYVSRAVAMGCKHILKTGGLFQMTDSDELTVVLTDFLLKMDATGQSIPPKEAFRPGLKTSSVTLGSVILAALPLSVLLAALLVLRPRKNR